MSPNDPKVTLSASIDPDFKKRLEKIAKVRRWTLSRTVEYLIEEFLDSWEIELNIPPEKPTTKPEKQE